MSVHHISAAAAALLIAMTAARPSRAQNGGDAIIDRAVDTYARTRTSSGTFEQAITNPLTGSTVRAKGSFQQQRSPARFSFRFTEPKGDMIIGDGRWLWVYLPSSTPNQVIKVPMTEGGAGGLDLASRFFESPRTRFTITDAGTATVAGHATQALVLVPKGTTEPFTRAKVWLDTDDGQLRQFETTEPSGLTRLVTVTSVTANAPVNAKLFTFTPPKGARIVDQQVLGGR